METVDIQGVGTLTIDAAVKYLKKHKCLQYVYANKEQALKRIKMLHENREERENLSKGFPFSELNAQYLKDYGMEPVNNIPKDNELDASILSCSYLIGISAEPYRTSLHEFQLGYYYKPNLLAAIPALIVINGCDLLYWIRSKWAPIFRGDLQVYKYSWIRIFNEYLKSIKQISTEEELISSLKSAEFIEELISSLKSAEYWKPLYDDMIFALTLQVLKENIEDSIQRTEDEKHDRERYEKRQMAIEAEEKVAELPIDKQIQLILEDPNSFVEEMVNRNLTRKIIEDTQEMKNIEFRDEYGLYPRARLKILRMIRENNEESKEHSGSKRKR
jgi:hypothetical protein